MSRKKKKKKNQVDVRFLPIIVEKESTKMMHGSIKLVEKLTHKTHYFLNLLQVCEGLTLGTDGVN